jgi:hypothetical protein
MPGGEPTTFDSLARLVPDELQAAYYRVLAHTRGLSPDDEMLRILEAMGVLALLTRHTPKDIADEREHFQKLLSLHRQSSDDAQRKMLGYVRELEARIADLPSEVEAGLAPKEIAKMLGESLRQHFLQCGVQDTVKALQTISSTMTSAQDDLANALHKLTDSHRGVAAQVERANQRVEYSLESRAKTMDALLHEWKSDLLHIWIPMIAGASLLVGMFGGMEIQGCRDSDATPAAAVSKPSASDPTKPKQQVDVAPKDGPTGRIRNQQKAENTSKGDN